MKHDYCVACGNKENLHQHHLVPKSHGGSNDETNLITLCGECHAKIHGNRSKWNSSELTKKSLQALKARGVKLGNRTNLDEARLLSNQTTRAKATEFADKVLPIVLQLRENGETLPAIADKLNSMGVKTRRGGAWYASTVANILKRK